MPRTLSRVVGSGNTVLTVNGLPVSFMTSVTDTPPRTVGQTVIVQGIEDKTPVEIVTPNALTEGSLQLTLVELWNEEAWERITGFSGAKTTLDVYERNLTNPDDIICQKIIKSPTGAWRVKVYHGCKITAITEAETITKDSMLKEPTITLTYLKYTFL